MPRVYTRRKKSSSKEEQPDAVETMVAEVETPETVTIDHTADQLRLFSAYAKKIQADFWVVVPKASAGAMKTQLATLSVAAKVWEM